MTFASIAFIIFFVVVVPVYYLCPARFRYVVLLLSSCYFYMAFVPKYILILFFVIASDFIFARLIEKHTGTKKKLFFISSLLTNVGVLFVFKYFNFFNENLGYLAHALHWNYSIENLSLLLPIGLSFHIFQSISYVVEVYRGKHPAEKHIGIYATYVLFFPQLVAGPIERPQRLLTQLKQKIILNVGDISYGLQIMLWGFFKKLVIADRLGIVVDHIYKNESTLSGPTVVIAVVFFAFQIYADFSGYSDIARGAAKVLGIDVMRNFRQPFFSRSVAEFWRRWHISLSSWFRDYFYYPLVHSSSHLSRNWLYLSILITFLVTGLWHGAGWTFLIMGLIHGVAIVFTTITKKLRDRIAKVIFLDLFPNVRSLIQIVVTFSVMSFSWIFFRSPDFDTALRLISHLANGWNISSETFITSYFSHPYNLLGVTNSELLLCVVGIAFLLATDYLQEKYSLSSLIRRRSLFAQVFVYATLFLLLFTLGIFDTKQFIYFQF